MSKGTVLFVSCSISFVLGALVAAMALDVFGDPSYKAAHILSSPVVSEQGDKKVSLPEGTTVQLTHYVDGQPYYELHFFGWPDHTAPMEEIEQWKYFAIQR